MSHVLSTGVAGAAEASAFFEAQLKFRTDPADLAADLLAGGAGIVVIDTRSPAHYAEGHIPGAISFPHRTMTASTTALLDRNLVYVCLLLRRHRLQRFDPGGLQAGVPRV